ncbi:MAG: citrate/2-methylcitrate synthase [Sphingomonadaceae bacterium]
MPDKKGGLEGVVALSSSICMVDGTQGKLAYRGIDIHDLAAHSTYPETAYLLWYGELPTQDQFDDLMAQFFANRALPDEVQRMIVDFMPAWDSMESLRTAVSALSGHDPGGTDHNLEEDQKRAISLTARMPTIIATYHRARQKQPVIAPTRELSTAANFLYMLTGEKPSERKARILDVALVVHADHELNASTFSARVAASTLADIYSAVTAAIGTLDGPLHGGANEEVMQMLEEIGSPENAERYVLGLISQRKKVPGFGHRVYKTADPRATELRPYAAELARETGETRLYDTARKVEEVMMRETGLNANLDFVSAQVYHLLGIPTDLMTPVFAMARCAGWTAHILEQYAHNRLIRPLAEYVGPRDVPYVPIEERGLPKEA